jgi:hypothetical protein
MPFKPDATLHSIGWSLCPKATDGHQIKAAIIRKKIGNGDASRVIDKSIP